MYSLWITRLNAVRGFCFKRTTALTEHNYNYDYTIRTDTFISARLQNNSCILNQLIRYCLHNEDWLHWLSNTLCLAVVAYPRHHEISPHCLPLDQPLNKCSLYYGIYKSVMSLNVARVIYFSCNFFCHLSFLAQLPQDLNIACFYFH